MRTARTVGAVVIILIGMALLMQGCLLGTSIQQRIELFEQDLNEQDRSDAYLNFYEGLTTDYDAIKNPDYRFNVAFPNDPADFPYTITILDESDSANVTAIISAPGLGGDRDITFSMAADGLNWLIVEIPYMESWGGKVID